MQARRILHVRDRTNGVGKILNLECGHNIRVAVKEWIQVPRDPEIWPCSFCPDLVIAPVNKWDLRYLALAEHVGSRWSKDPSTQVGAVIVKHDLSEVIPAFNGFPRRIEDREDRLNNREEKYLHTLHAEDNALIFAGERARGASLYTWPLPPCCQCAPRIIQSGVARVVSIPLPRNLVRWQQSCDAARAMFAEAGVEYLLIESYVSS